MPIIEVDHLTKEYRLGAMQGLKQSMLNACGRLIGKRPPERPLFKALDDVSFSIEPGEVVGVIGHNGAGKSTLLKLLSKISTPSRGTVKVDGRIAPLIEVGAGFVPDFTGRENVYLNGAILGMSKTEIDRKFDEIVDFAEMAEFIDTPVKRYSSGMQVKLAFAVATSVESEILLVDEVLAVGDLAFQRKCFDRMETLIKRENRTVLLVSHNIRQVERICTRTILLNHGRVLLDGSPKEVCDTFYRENDAKIRLQSLAPSSALTAEGTGEIELIEIRLIDEAGERTSIISYGKPTAIEITYKVLSPITNVVFGVGVHTTDFLYLADKDTEDDAVSIPYLAPGIYVVRCTISRFPLLPGTYAVRLGVAAGEVYRMALYLEGAAYFQVQSDHRTRPQGFVSLDTTWDVRPVASEFS